jgi:hypothetical protein
MPLKESLAALITDQKTISRAYSMDAMATIALPPFPGPSRSYYRVAWTLCTARLARIVSHEN